jgi:serine/threonine protein kinase
MSKEQTIVAGRYELSRQIGEGGMGKVYLAKHTELGQEVAIKCLRPESQSSANGAHRFYLEAKTYAAINHPNLVKLHDFERTEKGELRMVLEYVRGQTLGAFLKMYGALHPLFAIDIAIQIAQGLSAAHHDNILHRDLKPENIMLSPLTREKRNYHVKILDFGIAKQLDNNKPSLTALGMVCGTPDYMSPEQACGIELDKSSDIYSLGVVFYEMLTGNPPYKGNKRQVMSAHCTEPIPLISDRSPHPIPSSLEDVLQRCLAKNTRDRYKSLEELIAALDQVNLTNFDQKVPSYFLGKAKKDGLSDLNIDDQNVNKSAVIEQVIQPEESDAGYLQSEGFKMLPMKTWFHSIYKGLGQALQERNGQQQLLFTGVGFVLIIMLAVSISLKPRHNSTHDSISVNHHEAMVQKAKMGKVITIGSRSTDPKVLQDNRSDHTVKRENSPKQPAVMNRGLDRLQELEDIRKKQEKILQRQKVLVKVDQAYWQGELEEASRLIQEFKDTVEAKPLYKKIKALKRFQTKVKNANCKKRASLFKQAPNLIADHPFITDGASPCRQEHKPPLFMK